MNNQYFIIDFDSTFVQVEGLEELANITLKDNPKKDQILAEIKKITNLAMEGKIGFDESLSRRMKFLRAKKEHINELIKFLKKKISPSVVRNKKFFKQYKGKIYIITGGFKEWVIPVVKSFGIDDSHVLANTFTFDKIGNVIGYDKKNVLSKSGGKALAVAVLHLKGAIVVGDGYTDYEIKREGFADKFIAFTENVYRKPVVKLADQIASNFDEFLYYHKLPMSVSFPKNRICVTLFENISQHAVSTFEKEGYKVEWYEKTLPEKEIISKIKNTHILGIRSRTNLAKNIFERVPRLMTVGAFCIGVDQIALQAAANKGIVVFNAPYSNTRSVVEMAVGEMIVLMRKIFEKSRLMQKGVWDKSADGSNEVRGKTLGIVGYGNIGSQISVLAEALGMKVIYYDLIDKLPLGNAKKCTTLSELLKQADVISVHVDGRFLNEHLISEKEFNVMKKNVVFINLSRGIVVDLQALAKHLKEGKLKGAAVDVFPYEPAGKQEKFVSDLQNLPNVILTPHIGGSTEEAQKDIGEFVSRKIVEFINTGSTYLSVNMPSIQLSPQKNAHRMLHLHQNIPGVLAEINSIFAKNTINVLGQYLQTKDQIGYVITDIDKKYDTDIINELKKVKGTMRFRTLY